jgi:hypothetical protein
MNITCITDMENATLCVQEENGQLKKEAKKNKDILQKRVKR